MPRRASNESGRAPAPLAWTRREAIEGHVDTMAEALVAGDSVLFAGRTATAVLESGKLVKLPPSPGPRPIYLSRTHGFLRVDCEGAVETLENRSWRTITPTDAGGFESRSGFAAAWDPTHDRVVVAGGKGLGSTTAKSTLAWDGTRWHAVAPHLAASGVMVFERARERMLFVASRAGGLTAAFDGDRWETWKTRVPQSDDRTHEVIFHDSASGLTGLVHVYVEDAFRIFLHRGEGIWDLAGIVSFGRDADLELAVAWHGPARALHAYGRIGGTDSGDDAGSARFEIPLGDFLDREARRERAVTTTRASNRPSQKIFVMHTADDGPDSFGGVPSGLPASDWPSCRSCRHPMDFIARFAAHRDRLPLREHTAILLFVCGNTFSKGACESFDPDSGCNRLMLVRGSMHRASAPGSPPEGAAPLLGPRKIRYRSSTEATDGEPRSSSKLGGSPAWLQGDATPVCDTCRRPMRFVGQLQAALDRRLNFGDGGIAFLFVCDDEHQAKALWQD